MFNELSDFDKGWVVGILEGEGCFRRNKNSMVIEVQMKDKDSIDKLNMLLNTGRESKSYEDKRIQKNGEQYSTMWRTTLYGNKAKEVMLEVFPYMCERRKVQIQGALI